MRPARVDDSQRPLWEVEPDPARDRVEEQLHGLDHRINQLRQRLILLKRGAVESADPEREIAALEQEYLTLGEQFAALYKTWQQLP